MTSSSFLAFLMFSIATPAISSAHPADDGNDELVSASMATLLPFVVTGTAIGTLALSVSLSQRGGYSATDVLGVVAIPFIFAGPSSGQVYAGNWLEAGLSTGARVVGLGFLMSALASGDACQSESCEGEGQWAGWTGVALISGSTIYSIVDGPRAARRRNHERSTAQLTPMPMRGPSGSHGWGAGYSTTF